MAFRFQSSADTVYLQGISIGTTGHTSAVPRTGMRLSSPFATGYTNMASADDKHFTMQWQYKCEESSGTFTEKVIGTVYDGTPFSSPKIHHAVTVTCTSGTWVMKWHIGGTANNGTTSKTLSITMTGFNCASKWLTIFCTYIRGATAAAGTAVLTIVDLTGRVWVTSATVGNLTDLATLEPTSVAFGNIGTLSSGSNTALGIKAFFVSSAVVVANTAGVAVAGLTTFDARQVVLNGGFFGIFQVYDKGNQLALGHYCGGGGSSWSCDSRPPSNATTTIGAYDRFNNTFAGYYGVGRTASVAGSIPVVSPFDYEFTIKGLPSLSVNPDEVDFSWQLKPSDGPIGTPGTKTRELIKQYFGTANPSSVVRFGVVGNSRAMYTNNTTLVLSDNTVTSRSVSINYNEYGFIESAPLFNGNLIGAYKPAIADDTVGGFGFDCSTNGILCKDSGGTTVAASSAFVARATTLDTTLCSRGWVASRDPSVVDGSAEAYRGNSHMRLLSPGYYARWMWRPEAGTPVTEGLRIGVVLRGFAESSGVTNVFKVTTSSAQNGAPVARTDVGLSAAVTTASSSKNATAVSAPTYISARDHPTTVGSITVDNSDHAWDDLKAGDLLMKASSYEQVIVRAVSGTTTLVIQYEWFFKTNPIIGNTFKWIPATESYQVLEFDFAANEASANQWRGIEIKAGATGAGVLVACVYAYVPNKDGSIIQYFGRHGCGQHVQAARHGNVISPRDNKTDLQRVMDILQTDVMFISAADQGSTSNYYHTGFELQLSRFTTAWPDLECVMAQCMIEPHVSDFVNEGITIESSTKAGTAAAMYHVAQQQGIPCVGWYLDDNGWRLLDAMADGKYWGESTTHPLCGGVVRMWMNQLKKLAATYYGRNFRKASWWQPTM